MTAARVVKLEAALLDDLHGYAAEATRETARLTKRKQAIQGERYKWADQAMEGAVPRDIAQAKQEQLAVQLAGIEEQLAAITTLEAEHERAVRAALRLAADCGEAYERGTDATRRAYNQAWLEQLRLDSHDDHVVLADVDRTELGEALHTAEVTSATDRAEPDTRTPGSYRYRVLVHVRGSNVSCLVELRGIEPLTYSMRTSRATNCAIAPDTGSTGYQQQRRRRKSIGYSPAARGRSKSRAKGA